jgi:hypothetical protein
LEESMSASEKFKALTIVAFSILAMLSLQSAQAEDYSNRRNHISHVLLISVDGMHALDFANCSKGISTVNNGIPYCPHLVQLSQHGTTYVQAYASRPSDSFPGLTALITGGTPRSTGTYYDVAYDRSLSPPAETTPGGILGGPCPGQIGTQVGFDESIDVDSSRIDGGGGINPNYLPRDPKLGCAPVYPHNFLRVNTIFEVVKAGGGYTAWSDKHRAYDFVNGPSGSGVDDDFNPEVASTPRPLNLAGYNVPSCHQLPDPNPSGDWTSSFLDIQCYDKLKVQAILNEIDGETHDGSGLAPVPALFGMNFQSVSIGQKLVEKSIGVTGGYLDALGTPSSALLGEIQFIDQSIGEMISELNKQGLADSTLIIVTAKHAQSPIDPNRILRIPADNSSLQPPSAIVGSLAAQALEDDVSLIWLADQGQLANAVGLLAANEAVTGAGEIFAGPSLDLLFNNPASDPRPPDIVVAPNVGVTYTGGTKKVAEHGGFANDDRNVVMLIANPKLVPAVVRNPVETRQVAPTILKALGLNPESLQAVRLEHTTVLPGLSF